MSEGKILTDDKYCDTRCSFLKERVKTWWCSRFLQEIFPCLGGGPLRCDACIATYNNSKEKI